MKTRELEGAPLTWAVAKAEGWDDEMLAALARQYSQHRSFGRTLFWEQVGPLIERYLIELHTNIGDQYEDRERWYAVCPVDHIGSHGALGPTPLIAAMRALVFAQLGEEIDLPEGLQ